MAGGPGFEPGLMESESIVLPLNDPPIVICRDKACLVSTIKNLVFICGNNNQKN